MTAESKPITELANDVNWESSDNTTNANEKENKEASSTELISYKEVPNTMFTIVNTTEGSFIAIGSERVTEMMTEGECEEQIANRSWRLIEMAIIALMRFDKERQELTK